MSEAPEVYCPREGKKVPIWWCIGSFTQKRITCSELIEAIDGGNFAKVECKARNFAEMEIYR